MKRFIVFLVSLYFAIPGLSLASPSSHSIHIEWSYDQELVGRHNLAGYHLYKEGLRICTTATPDDTSMDCEFESESGESIFTLTAFYTDGTESPHSNSYSYNLKELNTIDIQGTPLGLTGPAPFSIHLDAHSAGGSNIISYKWSFGDGETAKGRSVDHTYMSSGIYNATLSITNELQEIITKTISITVKNSDQTGSPPTAIIASSKAVGVAPLQITLNGSSSTAGTSPIQSYQWNFGDGSSATGRYTTHTFTTAGVFQICLTVTDMHGLSNTIHTPVIVTQSDIETNKPPLATITVLPQNSRDLTVLYNAFRSKDIDGEIISYAWNFGDGASGTGPITQHTYSKQADYIVSLTVTDNNGATATVSSTISPRSDSPQPEFQVEIGEVEIDNNWVHVQFDSTFQQAIVVAGPPSSHDNQPCVIRLRNIDTNGFDIRLQEWDYLDGTHQKETIDYMVMNRGNFTLADGSHIQAGVFIGKDTIQQNLFSQDFTAPPVVITSLTSFYEKNAMAGVISNISSTGFAYKLQEQELNPNNQKAELINFIAWEPGVGNIDSFSYEVVVSDTTVNQAWHTIHFANSATTKPIFLAELQTVGSTDTAVLRYQNLYHDSVQCKVEEEQSNDAETSHTTESVGYIAIGEQSSIPPNNNTSKSYAINFQPAKAPVPSNFVPDIGSAYTTTSGFGWVAEPAIDMARDRNSNLSPDQSYDTTLPARNNSVWKIDLPNGQYQVDICIGEAAWHPGGQYIQINGEEIVTRFNPTDGTPWLEKQTIVNVHDGNLTITFDRTNYTQLNWIKIQNIVQDIPQDLPPANDDTEVDYSINFQPANAVIPDGFMADSGSAYNATNGFGWVAAPAIDMARDRNSNLSPDQSYDTTLPARNNSVWKIDLPNGQYQVDICIGEAGWHPGGQYIQINGDEIVTSFNPTDGTPWLEKQTIANVHDGHLILTFDRTNYTQLNWIKIQNIVQDIPQDLPPVNDDTEADYSINFQPVNAVIPDGFMADSGRAYNATDGFGWVAAPAIDMARDRNSDLSPDQSYDTTLPARNNSVWKIDLPNGQYQVDVCIGEAGWHPGGQYIQINGEEIVTRFNPTDGTPWLEKQTIVNVHDGNLTLTFDHSNYTQLNWIKIQNIVQDIPQDLPPANDDTEVDYSINFQPANADIPDGFMADSGREYNASDGFGWVAAPAIEMARDRNSDLSPDQSYDTTLPARNNSVWKIDLPNGQYQVDICIGEAAWHPGGQYMQINEEEIVTRFNPNNNTPWLEKTIAVDILDGKLTFTFHKTNYTQLNWLKIKNR